MYPWGAQGLGYPRSVRDPRSPDRRVPGSRVSKSPGKTLLTVIFKLHTGVFPARAGGRGFWGTHVGLHLFNSFVIFFFVGFKPWEVAHLFSPEVSRRMPSEWCLGTPWGPSYEHMCKNIYLGKGWIGLDPWLKRALKTISNGVLKIQHAKISVSVMRILL